MTVYSAALVESAGIGGPYNAALYRKLSLIEGLGVNDFASTSAQLQVTLNESFRINSAPSASFALTMIAGLQINDVTSWIVKPGAVVVEGFRVNSVVLPQLTYHLTITEGSKIKGSASVSYAVLITEGFLGATSFSAYHALKIVEGMRASMALSAQGQYHVVALSGARFSGVPSNAIGASITHALGLGGVLSEKYIAQGYVTTGVEINEVVPVAHMVFHPSVEEDLEMDDLEIVQMIYKSTIIEGADVYILYAEPAGDTTTWVMNTRTNALTEYRNWNFNSFASMGRKYLGASQQGLYELNGPRDDGVNTNADIAGGFLELADGKLAGVKGVYIGLNEQGTYLLKLVDGMGVERVYQFVSQPGMLTSKVIVGKGIRTRYLRWELISTGDDFDLSTIEFVPMISGRRV